MNLPPSILAALDALESCYPSYSAFAARARAEVERLIGEALTRAPTPTRGERPRLVSEAGGARGAR